MTPHRSHRIIFWFIFCMLMVGQIFPSLIHGQGSPQEGEIITPSGLNRSELETQAKARAEELEKINKQISAMQDNLKNTVSERVSLQQEIKKINQNVQQLQLDMRSNELTIEKLGFELETTAFDIEDTETSINDRKAAMVKAIQELQKQNAESGFLFLFLKHANLVESVFKIHALLDLNEKLHSDVKKLHEFEELLLTKQELLDAKKHERTVHRAQLTNRRLIIEDQERGKQALLSNTKNKESLYEQQLKELEKQQTRISDEIEKIEDELRARFDASLLPAKRPAALGWPVALYNQGGRGRITQVFGERSSLYRGKPHNGLDIGVPVGTPVFAAEDGEVIAVDTNDVSRVKKYQYGKYVLISHGNNLATLYAHLSGHATTKGSHVKRGDVIGYSGSTGYATGPHLHFGLYWAPSIVMKAIPPAHGLVPIGVVIDPMGYL